ncbi:hypothetical protein HAX54_014680, partial [Datura stramonium]|nr:hypothetical protein [Datura stramonium]
AGRDTKAGEGKEVSSLRKGTKRSRVGQALKLKGRLPQYHHLRGNLDFVGLQIRK